MESMFLVIVVFLMVLAVFDLFVGVSNDAVNFINSAVGSKAAKLRTILIVSAIGVFAGAALSNGMMDVARHGIYVPEYYSFYDVMCIFLAVMITDVILLDVFNTLGLPTSTTVSMVFELLGGAFALALVKVCKSDVMDLSSLGSLINTDKAVSVIIAIFVSVAIAFFFGTIVQWIARVLFTFTYQDNRVSSKLKILGLGALSGTCIVWFLLISGLKHSALMTPELKEYIAQNTWIIVSGVFGLMFVVMSFLMKFHVNILKTVVLMGTFALAMAFAGNDLVNFVGVPLTGLDAFMDYQVNGGGNPEGFMMKSLMGSAHTPIYYLISAGAVMVFALVFSKKSRNVTKTEVGLGSGQPSDEMFGSSGLARGIVRGATSVAEFIDRIIPEKAMDWIDRRFNQYDAKLENGAAFDLLRASINLVLAGLLVALGTSLKLPLSTTYVTFMVAMGTSLADRAWARERAVFRITGVLSVIGGWFVTAVAAFLLCMLVVCVMYFGGYVAMIVLIALAIFLIVRSNLQFAKGANKASQDPEFEKILASTDRNENWKLLCAHVSKSNSAHLNSITEYYQAITDAFLGQQYRTLKRADHRLEDLRIGYKRIRRREIIALRAVDPILAMERNTWFYLANNSCQRMIYCLKNINEPCREHVGNSFLPLSHAEAEAFIGFRNEVVSSFKRGSQMMENRLSESEVEIFRADAQILQDRLSAYRKSVLDRIQSSETNIETMTLFLNMVQESQELVGSLRHAMRGMLKFEE